jgi:hypothetical protein
MTQAATLGKRPETKLSMRARPQSTIQIPNKETRISTLATQKGTRNPTARITNIRTNQQGLMERIWKLVIEVLVEPGDMPSGLTKGFMNVTTWADSAESARDKLDKYIERFKWHVISIEDARPIADDEQFEDESMEDMIARTRTNPNAIILGTFHGYKEN